MKLSDMSYDKYSQFGEDGIINEIFRIIGTTSRVCVEFGAWDGFHLSNTANLWTSGWRGILIEADPGKFKQLAERTARYDCECICARVLPAGANTIEEILRRKGVTSEVDLMSIDIDGDDYHIFASLGSLRPRVMVCEYNPTIPAEMDLVPALGNYFGCSASALVRLAAVKGYSLVALTDTNCLFVRSEYAALFAAYDTSLELLKITKYLTYLMSGYDGRYVASGSPVYGCTEPSGQRFVGKYFAIPRQSVLQRLRNCLKMHR